MKTKYTKAQQRMAAQGLSKEEISFVLHQLSGIFSAEQMITETNAKEVLATLKRISEIRKAA